MQNEYNKSAPSSDCEISYSVKKRRMKAIRRNARERKKTHLMNEAFFRLRELLPCHRLSKCNTLKVAVHYIRHLNQLLE